MKSDNDIRQDVIRELEWDPQVSDADAIGVAAKDGAVTLTGFTTTYAEKLAAVRAAGRVYGVKAVADELRVRLTAGPARDDADIARAIAHVLEWNTQIPEGQVRAEVRGGWWFYGHVHSLSEASAAAAAAAAAPGVADVESHLVVSP